MAINLPANAFGVIIFITILIFLQFFFGVIGAILCNHMGLNGLYWWVIVMGIVLIGDLIFINIE